MIYSSKHTDYWVIISNIFEKDGYHGYLCNSYTFKVSFTVVRKAREVAMTVLILHTWETYMYMIVWHMSVCLIN